MFEIDKRFGITHPMANTNGILTESLFMAGESKSVVSKVGQGKKRRDILKFVIKYWEVSEARLVFITTFH